MTVTPDSDLVKYPRYLVEYLDGGQDVFAVDDFTLQQGPSSGMGAMLAIIAREWQDDGYLKEGEIVAIQRVPTDARN